jgi:hypothetical protein
MQRRIICLVAGVARYHGSSPSGQSFCHAAEEHCSFASLRVKYIRQVTAFVTCYMLIAGLCDMMIRDAARREGMRASIIEVGLPTSNLLLVHPAVEACLRKTGDVLIGRQIYDDQALLVVRLFGDTVQCHLEMLSEAFHKNQIDSFQVVTCHLFKVVFKDEGYQHALRGFPLHPGESWFLAVEEPYAAYLCLLSPQLDQEQISWLAAQKSIVQWTKES